MKPITVDSPNVTVCGKKKRSPGKTNNTDKSYGNNK
jgi:hypothetical protein